MKMFKKFVALMFVVIIAFSISVPAFAATKKKAPYKDIILKYTVCNMEYRDICWLKKHHAFDGVIKGKYFYPNKYMTKKQFLKMCINIFGKKHVPVTKSDKKNYKKTFSTAWAIKKLNAIEKKQGGVRTCLPYIQSKKVSRLRAAIYLYDSAIELYKKK